MHDHLPVTARIWVLYIDDIAYSGQQAGSFFSGHTLSEASRDRLIFVPCLAYVTQAAVDIILRNSAPVPCVMPIPPIEMALTPLDTLTEQPRMDEFQARFKYLGFRGTLSASTVTELWRTLVGLSTIDPLKQLSLLRALVLFYRLLRIDVPVLLSEHKLADSTSLPHSFLYLQLDGTLPQSELRDLGESLVLIGGKPLFEALEIPADGSEAFYKRLEWHFNGRVNIPDATLIRTFFALHAAGATPQCSACGSASAANFCQGCGETFYCNSACQDMHWRAGHKVTCSANT